MNNSSVNSPFIFEVTAQNVRQVVLEASSSVPVLLDVWAEWCQPCKALTPILEKLVLEYKGRFHLAKLNADAQEALAMQLGVQSLPTLKLIVDGQMAGELNGLQPEKVIRELLDKFVKPDDVASEKDDLLDSLRIAIAHKDNQQARLLLDQLVNDFPGDAVYSAFSVDVSLLNGEYELAKEQFDQLSAEIKESDEGKRIAAKLYIVHVIQSNDSSENYLDVLARNPRDSDALYYQAAHYASNGQYDEALAMVWTLFQSNMAYKSGEPRVIFLKLFDILGKTDERSHIYRRKIFNFLH